MGKLRTLAEALDEAAATDSGFTFLSEAGARECTFAALRAAARRVAGGLRRAGLRRGDVVALVVGDAEQFLTTFFGAAIAGLIPASLYPPPATADLPRFLETTTAALAAAAARAVLTTAALRSGFAPLCSTGHLELVLDSQAIDGEPVEDTRGSSPDDVAFVQFTSGSTSLPKGVVLTHRSLAANIAAFHSVLSPSREDVGVSWLPLYHDMGLVGMSLGALYAGRPAVLMRPEMFVKRPVEWLRALTRARGTVSFAPNFAYDLCVRRVKDRDLEGLDLSAWRVAGCGAEPIHAATLRAFAEKFAGVGFRETAFLPSYGLAEHVLAATFGDRGRPPRVQQVSAEGLATRRVAVAPDGERDGAVALVSCGRPLPGHALRIVREDGTDADERQVGEIALSGPSVMVGYYRAPELTAATIRDGWLYTGDLGYLMNGELFVCGRMKDLIVVNGRKYHPQDLEWGLGGVAGLKRGRVVAFGTSRPGSADRVVIVAEPSGTVPAAALAAEVRRTIGDLFGLAVSDVVLAPGGTIGRTTSGKLQRSDVRARYERGEWSGAADPAGLVT